VKQNVSPAMVVIAIIVLVVIVAVIWKFTLGKDQEAGQMARPKCQAGQPDPAAPSPELLAGGDVPPTSRRLHWGNGAAGCRSWLAARQIAGPDALQSAHRLRPRSCGSLHSPEAVRCLRPRPPQTLSVSGRVPE
jgi:hypothetical protein